MRRGEVFEIVGPNGTGKTTTSVMVEGLRPGVGAVTVDGLAVWPHPQEVKRRIGVQLHATALLECQKLHEIICLFGSRYGIRRSRAERVAVLERVGIADRADAHAKELSGGQAQRLCDRVAVMDPAASWRWTPRRR